MTPELQKIINLANKSKNWRVIDAGEGLDKLLSKLPPRQCTELYDISTDVCVEHKHVEDTPILLSSIEASNKLCVASSMLYTSWIPCDLMEYLPSSDRVKEDLAELGLSFSPCEHPDTILSVSNSEKYSTFKEYVSKHVGNRLNSHLWGVRSADIRYVWSNYNGYIDIPFSMLKRQRDAYGVTPTTIAGYILGFYSKHPDVKIYKHSVYIKGELSAVSYVAETSTTQYVISCHYEITESNKNYYPYPIAFLDIIKSAVENGLVHTSGTYFPFKYKIGSSAIPNTLIHGYHKSVYSKRELHAFNEKKELCSTMESIRKSLLPSRASVRLEISSDSRINAYLDNKLISTKKVKATYANP